MSFSDKSLCDLWTDGSVRGKTIAQLVVLAGAGKLADGNESSSEIRSFFRIVHDSSLLSQWVGQCLARSFDDAEFVLQDLINEIGLRLGFAVEPGLYRGKPNSIGFDGIWRSKDHTFVIEIKTSDVHSIKIEKVATYRRKLIEQASVEKDNSSILIIVGSFDTDAFECQVRGSKHAWDIRLLSIESLLKLLITKEAVDDPSVFNRIIQILQPRDFTKLDEIIELVFSTATEIETGASEEDLEVEESIEPNDGPDSSNKHSSPVNFHPNCVERASAVLGVNLIRDTRHGWISSTGSIKVQVGASKVHEPNIRPHFWFGVHPHQIQRLLTADDGGYFVLGCGSEKTVFMIPVAEMTHLITDFSRTKESHWHVVIHQKDNEWFIGENSRHEHAKIAKYLLA